MDRDVDEAGSPRDRHDRLHASRIDLEDDRAAGNERARSILEQDVHDLMSVRATGERIVRVVHDDLRLEGVEVGERQVGRVGDEDVRIGMRARTERVEEVARVHVDPRAQPPRAEEPVTVLRRERDGGIRPVADEDDDAIDLAGDGESDRTGPAARLVHDDRDVVGSTVRTRRSGEPDRETREHLRLGTWDEHAGSAHELEVTERGGPEYELQRFTCDATRHQLVEGLRSRSRERTIRRSARVDAAHGRNEPSRIDVRARHARCPQLGSDVLDRRSERTVRRDAHDGCVGSVPASASRASSSAARSASTSGSSSPPSIRSGSCSDRPMRWSVIRDCGRL